nr:immunoglobulin light chain junction region [Macaca mulatta]
DYYCTIYMGGGIWVF